MTEPPNGFCQVSGFSSSFVSLSSVGTQTPSLDVGLTVGLALALGSIALLAAYAILRIVASRESKRGVRAPQTRQERQQLGGRSQARSPRQDWCSSWPSSFPWRLRSGSQPHRPKSGAKARQLAKPAHTPRRFGATRSSGQRECLGRFEVDGFAPQQEAIL